MKEIEGRNGGVLRAMEKGDAPLPNAGKKQNPFKQTIREVAEGGQNALTLEGYVINEETGEVTGQKVRVSVLMPSVLAVVYGMFKKASKGNVGAARWLSETAFGKTVNLANDEENPIGGGFAVVLPPNRR